VDKLKWTIFAKCHCGQGVFGGVAYLNSSVEVPMKNGRFSIAAAFVYEFHNVRSLVSYAE
jgi:hypothetical protein